MIPDTDWEPTPNDIDWQKQMLKLLANKGSWAVPVSQSVFELDKPNKKFKLIIGDADHETNRRIAKVFKHLGFSEVDANEDPLAKFNGSNN